MNQAFRIHIYTRLQIVLVNYVSRFHSFLCMIKAFHSLLIWYIRLNLEKVGSRGVGITDKTYKNKTSFASYPHLGPYWENVFLFIIPGCAGIFALNCIQGVPKKHLIFISRSHLLFTSNKTFLCVSWFSLRGHLLFRHCI